MKPKINGDDFYKVIEEAIAENDHVEYLQAVLKKYENYKQTFEQNFTDKNLIEAVYKFRATYLLKKPLWRDIEILGKQTFCDLAKMIIKSMNWDNDHMHGFEFLEKSRQPDPFVTGSSPAFFAPGWEDDPHPFYKTNEIRICDIDYTKRPKLEFTFDYGDGHLFSIDYKNNRSIGKNEKINLFPRVIDQRSIAPEQYPEIEEE